MSNFGIIALTPANCPEALRDPSIALAAAAAGGIGVLNAEFGCEPQALLSAVQKVLPHGNCGIKCGIDQIEEFAPALAALASARHPNVLILTPGSAQYTRANLKASVKQARALGLRVLVEAVSTGEASTAAQAGADGVVGKGHEASGRVGDDTSYVLVQKLLKHVSLPVYVEGGIGLHTAAACYAAGAAGVVLDGQLLLTRESPLPPEVKAKIARLDGSQCLTSGAGGELYRLWARPGFPALEKLNAELRLLEENGSSKDRLVEGRRLFRRSVSGTSGAAEPTNRLWPLGQDVALAYPLARQFRSVAAIIQAMRAAAAEHLSQAARLRPLDENSPLAVSHATRYPIVQGAMTRVSDTAEFAASVAKEGGVPFLALALMRADEIERLLADTKEKLGGMPWGVGMLGFVPQQLRQEQLAVIERYKPPLALIAGGRPDQAHALEELGIKTYLHVPSPLLLKSFIELGSRRFIFEGKECGGHVGPRSSFVLWESMIEVLLSSAGPKEDAQEYHILFAGGIHDDLSAAMVATMAAPLAVRGMRVGVLMGTAYLFTKEAVTSGAIVSKFQEAALRCERTVLLETGPGHAIRCIDSPYKQIFDTHRKRLEQQGQDRNAVREELELMNLGRLRIASKGIARQLNSSTGKSELAQVPPDEQWRQGMYMIGQVAALHRTTTTVAELHSTVSRTSTRYLEARAQEDHAVEVLPARQEQEGIAIVGMSCIFPQASNLEAFWENILNKLDAIVEVPEDYWDWKKFYDPDPLARDKISSKWGGFLPEIPFEPMRYGIPPSSVPSIDPMQLLILEATRAALIDAGYANREFPRERTSVLLANAGHGPTTAFFSLRSMLDWVLHDIDPAYRAKLEERLPEWTEDVFPGYLGNVTAGRVANRFDLGGINFSIDAACASSLAALYVAMRELRAHASDVVLLAATDTHNQPGDYLSFSKVHALSRQGRCRTFDASADGIVISEGIAMLVLKRVSDARRDGDRIYAVVKGIGGSSDGRDLSLTAPRPAGQVLALKRAYEDAGVSPASVGLVEAHGTGTVVGDKAEVEALRQIFDASGAERRACAIGSVKTMIGHTKCAAGLASIIKVAKALHHKVLPPTIGVEKPNPACEFETSPFYINTEARPWIHNHLPEQPRRAAVSAFGFGGTNFHAVLEEYPDNLKARHDPATGLWPSELFLVRGSSRQGIIKAAGALSHIVARAGSCAGIPDTPVPGEGAPTLKSLAVDWHMSRSQEKIAPGEQCLAIVATSLADLKEKLDKAVETLSGSEQPEIRDPRGVYFSERPAARDKLVAFLFPGQGSQQVDMLRELSLAFPEVRETLQHADSLFKGRFAQPLSRFVYPPPAFTAEQKEEQRRALTDTHVAQPAIAACDLAVLAILRSFGVTPHMVAGHSFGEYVALYAAGALTADDLLRLSEARGSILARADEQNKGAMAAVSAGPSEIRDLLEKLPGVVIANVNAPNQCIISGDEKAVAEAVQLLKARHLQARTIPVSAAFHSPLMEPARVELHSILSKFRFAQPSVVVYSNTHASPYTCPAGDIAAQLADHLVKPVRFVDQINEMYGHGAGIFVEVGPGNVLTNLVDYILEGKPHLSVSVDRSGRHGITQLQHALAQLASAGVPVDPGRLFRYRLPDALDALGNTQPQSAGARSKLIYLINSTRIRRLPGGQTSTCAPRTPPAAPAQKPAGKLVSTGTHSASPALTSRQHSGGNKESMDRDHSRNGQEPRQAAIPASAGGAGVPPAPLVGMADLARTAGNHDQQAGQQQSTETASNRPLAALRSAPHSARDQIMLEFQRTMLEMTNSFLKTQQQVMLAYLKSGSSGDPAATAALAVAIQAAPPVPGVPTPIPPGATTVRQGNGHEPDAHGAAVAAAVKATTCDAREFAASEPQFDVPAPPSNHDTSEQQPAGEDSAVDPEFLVGALMEIVSERTGYPPEMLDPGLDLEADLGIDSIKRVEILNNFRKLLPESRQQQLESGLEKLAGIKTLQGIIDWIRLDLNQVSVTSEPQPNASAPHAAAEDKPLQGLKSEVARGLIQLVPLPAPAGQAALPDGTIIITDDGAGLCDALAESLTSRGQKVVIVEHQGSFAPGAAPKKRRRAQASGGIPRYRADLVSTQTVQDIIESIIQAHGQPAGLVHLLALAGSRDEDLSVLESAPPLVSQADSVYSLFLLLKYLAAVMPVRQTDKKAFVIAATDLGGDFASSPNAAETFNPISAGVVGVVKSAAKEWPGVRTRVVDFAQTATPDDMAQALLDEILSSDEHVEIGYKDGKRYGLEVVPAPLDDTNQASQAAAPPLDSSSIVLVSGGARGITAELCLELAQRYRPTFVILGRLPRPEAPEERETAGVDSPRELKAAIMERLKLEGKPVSVQAVESDYQKLLREREIRKNLEKLERAGSSVRYYAIDVRDAAAFGELIDRLYDTYGRVDGVIHGAGVIEDNLIQNKTLESFRRVFETKVSGALTLSRKLRLDTLKFFFLFSSVVGRTGNAGQTDYVAGNEVLNKLAVLLNRRSAARVCSLMWGPWRGGMAAPELESIFASYGWAMIEPSLGRESFLRELAGGTKGEAEVLLVGKPVPGKASSLQQKESGAAGQPTSDAGAFSASGWKARSSPVATQGGAILHRARLSALTPGAAEFKVVLNSEDDPYLKDHTFDGIPVMPMAIALELMAEAAQAAYPDWQLARVSQLDIPAGIVFETGSKELTVMVQEQSEGAEALTVQLSVAVDGTQRRTHFRCTADLTRGPLTCPPLPAGIPASFSAPAFLKPPAVLPKVRDIYDSWLFHGPIFQGVSTVDAMGSNGITGTLRIKGAAECLKNAGGNEWVVGPVLLDSAMQLAGVWARHYLDITVLPAGLKSLYRLGPVIGREFRAIVSIPREIEHGEMRCDLAIYDEHGAMVILVEGLGGIASKSFNRLASQPKALRTVR